jgi:hypothetical protein
VTVAAESTGSTVLATPTLACTYTAFSNAVAASTDSTVTVQVANSGTLTAFAPTVTLTLPTGWTLTSGANPRTLSDLAASGTTTLTWVVRSPSSGVGAIAVDATSTSYGETFDAATLSRNQQVDTNAPTATVSIAGGASHIATRNVTVTLTATDDYSGVSQMRVRHAGDAWGAWTAYAASVSATLPAGDGTKTFEAQFVDGVGNTTATISDTIVLDTLPPTDTFVIHGGATYVNTASVTLTHTSPASGGAAEMRFSNDGSSWIDWTDFTPTVAWTLAPNDGQRTVYAEYRDLAGNFAATSDSIVVETVAPTGTIVAAGGAAWTTVRGITLALSATDTVSGVSDMRFSDNGSTWSAWQPYATSAAWTLSANDGPKTVYAQFRDAAGNVSAAVSDAIGVDGSAPTGTLQISAGAGYATTGSVTLDVAAYDLWNGVSDMRFSNDDATWTAWTTFANTVDWTLAPGNGTRTVYVQFRDAVGNASASVSDSIVVDTVAPTGVMVILGDKPATNVSAVSLTLSWADADSGVSQVRASDDGETWSAWRNVQQSIPWTIGSAEGVHTVHAQFRDRAGNVSETTTDTIVMDTVAPSGTFALARGAVYVLPWETLTADIDASDGPEGSGVVEFRSSSDGGANWSYWTPIDQDGQAAVTALPAAWDAVVTIQGEIRDAAGNTAVAEPDSVFLLDLEPPAIADVASLTGVVGPGSDCDAFRLGLVAGDKLSLKVKTKTFVKKADASVAIDVYGPDGARLADGRYPGTSKKPGISKLEAPATGEYLIVLRASGAAADTGVSYAMTVTSAPVKSTRALKGVAPALGDPLTATIPFDACDGLVLGGTYLGGTATPPTLLAPDGTLVDLAVLPGKKGSLKLVSVALTHGTGTYTLTIPAAGEVKYQLALAAGKRAKFDEAALEVE